MRLGDEEVEAGAGTLVFVGEPRVVRSFTALEAGTTILTFGTNPGVEFVDLRVRAQGQPAPALELTEPSRSDEART